MKRRNFLGKCLIIGANLLIDPLNLVAGDKDLPKDKIKDIKLDYTILRELKWLIFNSGHQESRARFVINKDESVLDADIPGYPIKIKKYNRDGNTFLLENIKNKENLYVHTEKGWMLTNSNFVSKYNDVFNAILATLTNPSGRLSLFWDGKDHSHKYSLKNTNERVLYSILKDNGKLRSLIANTEYENGLLIPKNISVKGNVGYGIKFNVDIKLT